MAFSAVRYALPPNLNSITFLAWLQGLEGTIAPMTSERQISVKRLLANVQVIEKPVILLEFSLEAEQDFDVGRTMLRC